MARQSENAPFPFPMVWACIIAVAGKFGLLWLGVAFVAAWVLILMVAVSRRRARRRRRIPA